MGTAKTPRVPTFFEPPRRQGRQEFLNRQDAKDTKNREIKSKTGFPLNALGVLGVLAVQTGCSWRPWRLGGSYALFLAFLASWRFKQAVLGVLGALAVHKILASWRFSTAFGVST
ncbi:MAG: hypothetical protein WCY26_02470 [Thiohalobacteraceae bacterium]